MSGASSTICPARKMCPGLILLALPIAHKSSHELACQKLIKGGV